MGLDFKDNMKSEVNKLINHYWLKQKGYRLSISLDTFADAYTLIKDIPIEDPRKAGLSNFLGFDAYLMKTRNIFGKTLSFADCITANSDWCEII